MKESFRTLTPSLQMVEGELDSERKNLGAGAGIYGTLLDDADAKKLVAETVQVLAKVCMAIELGDCGLVWGNDDAGSKCQLNKDLHQVLDGQCKPNEDCCMLLPSLRSQSEVKVKSPVLPCTWVP